MASTGYIGGGSDLIEIDPRFRKNKSWGAELTLAQHVVAAFEAEVSMSDAAHQVAKIIGPDFKLVLYPHRTSAMNYHLRVRDEGSKNKVQAEAVMTALDSGAGFNCTFSRKNK